MDLGRHGLDRNPRPAKATALGCALDGRLDQSTCSQSGQSRIRRLPVHTKPRFVLHRVCAFRGRLATP